MPPVQFNENPIMEDVVLSLEHIRKLAVVELDYKIISPKSQKVLKTNNLNKENNYKGTTIQEYQKGMFLQEFIQADLPSDIKIMDELATNLSVELGNELVSYLTGIEKSFHSASIKSKGMGEKLASIELLANAVVINGMKLDASKNVNSLGNVEEQSESVKLQNSWLKDLKKQALEFK